MQLLLFSSQSLGFLLLVHGTLLAVGIPGLLFLRPFPVRNLEKLDSVVQPRDSGDLVPLPLGLVLIAGGDGCPDIGGELLSGACSAHQFGLHPFVGYSCVGLGRFVDVFEVLREQVVVALDCDDSSVGPIVCVTAHSM